MQCTALCQACALMAVTSIIPTMQVRLSPHSHPSPAVRPAHPPAAPRAAAVTPPAGASPAATGASTAYSQLVLPRVKQLLDAAETVGGEVRYSYCWSKDLLALQVYHPCHGRLKPLVMHQPAPGRGNQLHLQSCHSNYCQAAQAAPHQLFICLHNRYSRRAGRWQRGLRQRGRWCRPLSSAR